MLPLLLLLLAAAADASAHVQPLDPSQRVQLANPIDDLIRRALETLRANMSSGFPQWGLPPLDPWQLGDLPIDLNSDALTLKADFSQLTLTQLSQFSIDKIHTDLLKLKVDVGLSLPALTMTGEYTMDGVIALLFPLYGGGAIRVQVTHVPLEVLADLNMNGTGHYVVSDLDFDFAIGTLDVQMHGLFDSEDLASVIDGFADDFGPLLVDILVNDTRRDLIPQIIDFINNHLLSEHDADQDLPLTVNKPPQTAVPQQPRSPLQAEADAGEYFDRTLSNARALLLASGLDPLPLPDETLEVVGTGVKLHDGHLDGLAHVHRTGAAVMAYDGEWLSIDGHLGFNGLGAGYSCKIEVLHIGPDVTATATISETSVHFAARISSKTLAIELVALDIEEVGTIEVEISGLGIFDWLLAPLSQAIVNLLKGLVVQLINVIARPILANFLASIDLMDILYHII